MDDDGRWPRAIGWSLALAIGLVLWGGAICVAICVAFSVAGCATGRVVRDDVEITCAAIGEEAKVTYSVPTGEAGVITSAPTQLIACEGGPLVPSLLDGVGALLKALWTMLPWAG